MQCAYMALPFIFSLPLFHIHNSEGKVCWQEDILFCCNRAASCCHWRTRHGCPQGDILERLQGTWLLFWHGNYMPFLIAFPHSFPHLNVFVRNSLVAVPYVRLALAVWNPVSFWNSCCFRNQHSVQHKPLTVTVKKYIQYNLPLVVLEPSFDENLPFFPQLTDLAMHPRQTCSQMGLACR